VRAVADYGETVAGHENGACGGHMLEGTQHQLLAGVVQL
jgi:hypothetical protein